MTFQSYQYQDSAVKHIDDYDGVCLLAADPGLGKTYISLRFMKEHPERCFPALVVCPANVKYQWESEALQHLGFRPSICEGEKPPTMHRGFSSHPRVTIINYDILKYWTDRLLKYGLKTIIFDECQYLQNQTAKRTIAARKIAVRIPNRLGLSGTPITNRPSELFVIANILWPDTFPSWLAYANEFCNPKWTPWGWDYTGSSNLNRLHNLLKVCGMLRIRKEDVLPFLPEKIWRTVVCPLIDSSQYQEASGDFMTWLKKTAAHKVAKASKAEGFAKVGYLLRLAAKLKLRSCVEWANTFLRETDEKLILFAHHQKCIEALQRRIEAKSVVVDGTVTGRARQSAVDQFRQDSKTRVCIGSDAARVGLNLQVASEVGIVEMPWRPGDVTQMIDRAHRIGQKKRVFGNFLVAANTIEERLCRILSKKQEVISTVLDGGPVDSEQEVYDELISTLEGSLI